MYGILKYQIEFITVTEMKKSKKILIAAIMCLIISAFAVGCADGELDYSVRVMLADSENLTVTGENVISVKAGEAAEFEVSIPDGMKVASATGGAYYKDGKIIIDSVYFPVTVKTVVREYYDCTYSVSATDGGRATNAKNVTVREDDEVTVMAQVDSGYIFAGWSEGKSIENGGTVVCSDRLYKFNIASDIKLYANFITEDSSVIKYHANGGVVTENDSDIYVVTVEDDFHFYANTLPDLEYFEREDYILYGYNTEADGSGRYFGLGWNIVTDEKIVDLYCMWAKESDVSDFEYESNGKYMTILAYNGDDETVVVPDRIKGKKVTEIASGAFTKTAATTVILPSTLTTIEDDAFSACKLEKLYMPDTVTEVSDDSFYKCKSFSTLYVNAASRPKYQQSNHGTYSIKFERLMYAYEHDLPKLVFTSGSNGTYGIYSEQLEEGLNGEYYIVDYSLHYQTCGMFFIDLISNFLDADDIFLFLPEPNEFQLGTNEWNPIMWQFFEAAYASVTYVDIRDYVGVFDTFRDFNATRQWMSKTSYTDYLSGIDRYGDNSWYRNGESNSFIGSQGTYSLDTDHINVDNINSVIDKCNETGAKTYFSFPSLNKNALAGGAKKQAHRTRYQNYISDNLDITVISSIEDYIFNGRYMSGTNYHLSSEGTVIRTERLIDDIRAQLAKDEPDKWK